jgi:transposase
LADLQRDIGLMVGGIVGERLSALLHMTVGDDALLRLIRRTAPLPVETPRVLGVDDWAQRKGHTYGTVLVDLEGGHVVDVLPDREAKTLARWLQAHPGVEIVSRDRAGAYAEGVRQGAPHAQQVADRWHLLKNLAQALLKVLEGFTRELKQLSGCGGASLHAGVVATPESDQPSAAERHGPSQKAQQQQHRRARRYARYEEVRGLRHSGMSLKAIAQQTRLDRKTVRKYAQASTCPEPAPRQRLSILDPYKAYLIQRWQQGCCNARQLWRDIRQQGYGGSRSVVSQFTADLRRAHGLPPRTRLLSSQGTPLVMENHPLLTPRRATWLILSRPEALATEEQQLVARICQLHPDVEAAVTLAQAFAGIVRQRLADELDAWLEQALASALPAFRSFVNGVRRDYAAVKAGLSLKWSTGPVEGHINRLKFIKRQMYGRAKFDLLRLRVLCTG